MSRALYFLFSLFFLFIVHVFCAGSRILSYWLAENFCYVFVWFSGTDNFCYLLFLPSICIWLVSTCRAHLRWFQHSVLQKGQIRFYHSFHRILFIYCVCIRYCYPAIALLDLLSTIATNPIIFIQPTIFPAFITFPVHLCNYFSYLSQPIQPFLSL